MREYNRINLRALSVFLFLGVMLLGFASAGQASALWGELQPGPYAVGFKTIEKYDYQRPVGPILDYFGAPLEGERSRPMQICIWYPAEETADAAKMVYGEYAFAYPEDDSFINVLSALQNREIRFLYGVFANNRGLILDMMSTGAPRLAVG